MDLDAWINEPIEESDSESEAELADNLFIKPDKEKHHEPTEEELRKSREARKHEQQNNPHYLKGSSSEKTDEQMEIEAIPVTELKLNVQLKVAGQKRSDQYMEPKKTKKKGKKKKRRSESSSDENVDVGPAVEVKRDLELPEGATLSDSDSDKGNKDDPHRALDIDLDL